MNHPRVLLVAAFAFIASCDDGTGPNDLSLAGSMSFNFTGGGGGTFNVTGAIPLNEANLYRQSWAVGGRDDTENILVVTAVRAQGGGDFDEAFLVIPRLTPGSATIETCTTLDCPLFWFTLGANEDDFDSFNQFCMLETGTLTIATISSTRATGSFSGTGTCTSGTGTETTFIVTNGSFDVAVASDPSL